MRLGSALVVIVGMMRSSRRLVASVFALCLVGSSASASPILTIDQENLAGTTSFGRGTNATGQSFTPTLDSVDAIEVALVSRGSLTGILELFEGTGYGGPLLGSSASIALPTTLEFVHFDLAPSIALVPGAVYTWRLSVTGDGLYILPITSSNKYVGGLLLDQTGTPVGAAFDRDAVFREGLHDAVPEPASLLLLGTGLAGLVVRRYRARR